VGRDIEQTGIEKDAFLARASQKSLEEKNRRERRNRKINRRDIIIEDKNKKI
jgi:hypothetical protein